MKPVPALVRPSELPAYSPANHTGTSNIRVIGPETVGATALEVLVGTIVKSHGATPHAHPYLEQCAYMMDGTGESQAQGRVETLPPGSWSYVPAGVFHSFRVTSDQPGRLIVVYAPPYGENPAQTVTVPEAALQPAYGDVRVINTADTDAPGLVPLIDGEKTGARWVEIGTVRMRDGDALACAARSDAEQVLFLEQGQLHASAAGQDFQLAAGDFLFLPRGASAELRCPTGQRASGFLIKGRVPPSPTRSDQRNNP